MIKWPRNVSLFTYMTNSPIVLKEDIENQIVGQHKKGIRERPVSVGILDMRWFYRHNKTFAAFSLQLNSAPSSYYASEFIECMLDQFWEKAQKEIIKRKLIPYIVFITTTAFYMHTSNHRTEDRSIMGMRRPENLSVCAQLA